MPSILRRRNSIVDRIVNAVQYGTITTDQQVPAANSRLPPDIIVEEDNKVLIIDVCCPFDNDAEALRDAEQRKLSKYEGLKQFFIGQGKQMKTFCENLECRNVIVLCLENCVVLTQSKVLQTFTGSI